nr:hypothetical protein BaRGS_009882 [Batillaria attramentaria]
MSVIPEDRSRKMRLRTKVIADSNNPVYDEKFSLELSPNDDNKRVLISVWHKDQNSGLSEFLGCMSFGVKSIAQSTKEVNGWYYLLTEDVGKRKHLVASAKPRSSLKMRGHNNIPVINKDVIGLEPVTVSMARGKNGFGFSVVEEFPVKVGRVDLASPAESAGLKQGDYIIKVNNQNVSRSTVVSVAKLVKKSGPSLLLHVQRPRQPAQEEEPATNTAYRRSEPIYESIVEEPAHAESVADRFTHYQEHEISVDHDVTAPYAPFPTVPTFNVEQKKQEAIHRLLSLELDFIDFMHAGIQRYSRPLRHCILSVAQHKTVFQNVEKLVTISEYHVKQMQENSPSMCSESEDDSQSSDDKLFTSSVALIYHSKVHMFCQAHETYALGLSEANRVLSELRQNEDFVRFVKEPALEAGQPSISAFIFRPLQHIKELYLVLQDIYMFTPPTSPDHSTLRQVTQVLNESICSISNMSNARVQSLTSLTSHTKTSSTHGSSSGKGSSASSSASSATSTSSRDSCCSSHRSNKGMPTLPQSASMQSIHTVDREVMKLQDRLVFSENVPVFQLCQEDRHIIYQGEVFHWYGRQWAKTTLVLLSDLLLVLQADMDGSLHVLTNPLLLHDICGLEMDRKHGTEFVLHMCPTSPCTGIPASQKLVFRTPAIEDKFMWKRLLSQQVSGIRSEHTFENIYSSEVSMFFVVIIIIVIIIISIVIVIIIIS